MMMPSPIEKVRILLSDSHIICLSNSKTIPFTNGSKLFAPPKCLYKTLIQLINNPTSHYYDFCRCRRVIGFIEGFCNNFLAVCADWNSNIRTKWLKFQSRLHMAATCYHSLQSIFGPLKENVLQNLKGNVARRNSTLESINCN